MFTRGAVLTPVADGLTAIPARDIVTFVDAREGETNWGGSGESPASGLGWGLAQELPETAAVLVASLAVGGANIFVLAPDEAPYLNLIETVERAKELADDHGLILVVPAVGWVHGESNTGISYAGYDVPYDEMQVALDADIKAITGQTENVLLLAHQISGWTSGTAHARSEPVAAQVDRAISDPDRFLFSGANYPFTHSDGIHTNSLGKRRAGELMGRALGRRLVDEEAEVALRMASAVRAGAVIEVTYAGAEGGIVLDTSLVSDPGSYGFAFSQTGGNEVSISSVSTDGDTITVTLSDTPTGTAQKLDYARDGTPGAAGGPTTGARGCVRDGASAQGADGTALVKYAVHQTMDVT
jgi:hypothetical protein